MISNFRCTSPLAAHLTLPRLPEVVHDGDLQEAGEHGYARAGRAAQDRQRAQVDVQVSGAAADRQQLAVVAPLHLVHRLLVVQREHRPDLLHLLQLVDLHPDGGAAGRRAKGRGENIMADVVRYTGNRFNSVMRSELVLSWERWSIGSYVRIKLPC